MVVEVDACKNHNGYFEADGWRLCVGGGQLWLRKLLQPGQAAQQLLLLNTCAAQQSGATHGRQFHVYAIQYSAMRVHLNASSMFPVARLKEKSSSARRVFSSESCIPCAPRPHTHTHTCTVTHGHTQMHMVTHGHTRPHTDAHGCMNQAIIHRSALSVRAQARVALPLRATPAAPLTAFP
jgi:hypothetical protein